MTSNGSTLSDIFVKSNCGQQIKCSICDCWLPSSAQKFISSHLNGRKHKQQVEKKINNEKKLKCSVYVKGFDPVMVDLEKELTLYFESTNVKVKDVYIDKNSASYGIIEFHNQVDADIVLNWERPMFHTKKLIVKRREAPKKNFTLTSETKVDKPFESSTTLLSKELEDSLKQEMNTVNQMKILEKFYALSADDLLLRNLICELVENVLEELYPQCKVVLFGSSANGLGEQGCDVDITLIAESDEEEETVCTEVREIIQRFAPGCKNVSVVKSSKTCSIVKFLHTESNLSVDLSVNNSLAINNTKLLKTYMKLDERVSLLTFIIRKWAKCFDLSGRNNCQITQYSLTLMVIYFLQRKQPPVLPYLQEGGDSEVLVGRWNCYFHNLEENPCTENKMTAYDFLREFFMFYSMFDFDKNVIGIHSNSLLTRDNVHSTVNLLQMGDAVDDLKFGSPLVVQDPFKLSHNVTHNLSIDGLDILVESFKDAATALSDTETEITSLMKLFTRKRKCIHQKGKRKKGRSNVYTISLPGCQHSCSTSDIVCYDRIKSILIEDLRMRIEHSEDQSASKMKNKPGTASNESLFIPNVLASNSLKRSSDEIHSNVSSKKIKLESSIFSDFIVTAYADTWTNRRKRRRLIQKLQKDDDIVVEVTHEGNEDADSGIVISDVSTNSNETLNLLNKIENHPLLEFNVNITKALNENEICKLKLEPLDESKNLKDFQTFYAYIKKELIAVFK